MGHHIVHSIPVLGYLRIVVRTFHQTRGEPTQMLNLSLVGQPERLEHLPRMLQA